MSALRSAIGAEWTKLWTTRTVWWALAAATLLMMAGAGQYAIYAGNGDLSPGLVEPNGLVAAGAISALAANLAQFALIALAMLVMTSEYSTGTIRATLAWVPSRGRLLLAKCAVVAAVTLVAGTVLGFVGVLVAAGLLGDDGETRLAPVVADAASIGGYLSLISVFATGLGAALRGPVATLATVFLLVVVVPPVLVLPDAAILNRLADVLPGVAGDHFLRGDTDPYPPVAGLAILAAWVVAAVVAGWWAMRHRDA